MISAGQENCTNPALRAEHHRFEATAIFLLGFGGVMLRREVFRDS
jgi:hypothetical protein